MSDLVSLRFVTRMTPYSVGQVAGFASGHAQRLVAAGKAVYVNPPPGCDERGVPIKKEAEVAKPKTRRKAAKKTTEESDELEKRKSGKLGTVKK